MVEDSRSRYILHLKQLVMKCRRYQVKLSRCMRDRTSVCVKIDANKFRITVFVSIHQILQMDPRGNLLSSFNNIVNLNRSCARWVIIMRLRSVSVDMQYSNWEIGHPNTDPQCVVVVRDNYWISIDCTNPQLFVCQS